MAGHITRERDIYVFRGGGVLHMENGEACAEILMNGHWEELFGKEEELFDATDHPHNYRMHIASFLKLHVIKCVIEAMSSSGASGCASASNNDWWTG